MHMIVKDPIIHYDRPGQRMLDLRPSGVDCIPLLSQSTFRERRRGTVYHVHPGCTEICLCLKGRLMFESEGRKFNFLPGTVFVSSPDQPHRMRNNPKGLMVMSVLFAHPKPKKSILGLPRAESNRLCNALRHLPRRLFASTNRVKAAFARLFALYDANEADRTLRRIELRCATLNLLLAVVEASVRPPLTFSAKFRAVANRMLKYPGKDYPLSAIAAEVGMPEFRISEIFKQVTGLPPHAWLIECRIQKARQMLTETDNSIAAISGILGFSSPQHFASTFAKSVGLSPRAWRKHNTEDKPKKGTKHDQENRTDSHSERPTGQPVRSYVQHRHRANRSPQSQEH